MIDVILHTGSNLGDRPAHLAEARTALTTQVGHLLRASGLYQTAAWGLTHQPDFLNQALWMQTDLGPAALLDIILGIEADMGRRRTVRWGPRLIDIDLIFYGQECLHTPRLQVPHPRMHLRNFVLAPVAEIAPDWMHPALGKSVSALLAHSEDSLAVLPVVSDI